MLVFWVRLVWWGCLTCLGLLPWAGFCSLIAILKTKKKITVNCWAPLSFDKVCKLLNPKIKQIPWCWGGKRTLCEGREIRPLGECAFRPISVCPSLLKGHWLWGQSSWPSTPCPGTAPWLTLEMAPVSAPHLHQQPVRDQIHLNPSAAVLWGKEPSCQP